LLKIFGGYYNGQLGNTGLLPNLDIFEFPHEFEFISYTYGIPSKFNYNYTKNNRFTDHTKTQAYMLTKIIYPTGGYTELEYEPNSYKVSVSKQYIPDLVALTAAYKPPITVSATNVYTSSTNYFRNFSPSHSTTLYFQNTFSHGSPSTAGSLDTSIISNIFNNARISLSKSINGGPSIAVKTWRPSDFMTLPQFISAGSISFSEEIWAEYEAGAQYTIMVSYPLFTYTYPNMYFAQTYSQIRYYDTFGLDTSITKQGGLRIKSIKNYISSGLLANHKFYKYVNEDGTTSGELLNKFTPVSALESFCNPCNTIGPSEFKQVLISGTDFGLDGGTMIGYDRVEEIELANNGIDNIGKKVFFYNNFENKTKKGYPNSIHPLNGLIKTEQVFTKSGTKILEKTYLYSNAISPKSYDGIAIVRHCFGLADETDFNIGNLYTYSYQTNPLDTYWYRLIRSTTKENLNGVDVVNIQDFTYNNNGEQREITTTFATGETAATKYYYPGEVSNPLPIESTMLTAKMTGIPVVTEQYRGSQLLSRQSTEFTKDASTSMLIMPKFIYHKKGDLSGPLQEKRITFDQYDEKGNLLQYTLENGTPVSIIWGYNGTLPVAKIENAVFESINSSLRNAAKTTTLESQLLSVLSSIRTSMPNAMVTTYTYRPGVGVSTVTDPKGDRVSHEYDNFGRLKAVRDKEGNLLSENEYNFRP